MNVLRAIANEVGRGLIAGFVGAVAMTIASTLEMKLRKRPPSSAPADAAGKVLGVKPRDEKGKQRFANRRPLRVRQRVGTRARGDPRRRSARAGRRRASIAEPVAHFAIVWGVGLAMLPALGITQAVLALGHEGDRDRRPPSHRLRGGDRRRVPPAGAGLTMPFTQTRWLRAAGMAGITGSRTALGPALAVRRSGRSGWPHARVYDGGAGDARRQASAHAQPDGAAGPRAARRQRRPGARGAAAAARGERPPPARWRWAPRWRCPARSPACGCGGR